VNDHYPFVLTGLPYGTGALEPYLDAETVRIHHDRHLKSYVENLNRALKDYPQYHCKSLEWLLTHTGSLPPAIREAVKNNGGGVYNHNLYFSMMAPPGQEPGESTLRAVEKSFGSVERFRQEMKKAGLSRFGSGWAWLAACPSGQLKIVTTANQDTLLCTCLTPLLPLDVWEHAYYLKYLNQRGDYIDAWFHIINWKDVESRLGRFLL
jgi:Fe-Mn family superoxide dismutase